MAEGQSIRPARPSAVDQARVKKLFTTYITEGEAHAFSKRLDAGEDPKVITNECVALIKERQQIVMAVEAIFGQAMLRSMTGLVEDAMSRQSKLVERHGWN